jgi:hypothetical protein
MLAFGVIFVAVGYGLAAKEVRTIDVTLRRALAAEPAR